MNTISRRPLLALLCAPGLLLAACAGAPPAPMAWDSVVAAPDRSDADRATDARRKPALMLAFTGVRPGMQVLDISAARGYTSELLARAVGPGGRVYAQSPRPSPPLLERARLRPWIQPYQAGFDNPVPPSVAEGQLDLVTLMFNYHDLGHMGVDRARLNQAVFRALKPGGSFVVADHSGRPGTGISEAATLHRIEESFLRHEIEAAGFQLAARGDFYANPADPRDAAEPAFPKDEFILRFVKP
ncbi:MULTISPECIES: class I SAM-dependent methyltransferase [Ramlibacter]|uniref:Class I SAM-dependent methyltransferase n=1 Tax=Ramlibacter aquaticus TaxID=2780094 RepID=A0ABR9S9J0_9BURK|nr:MULTISPECIES: class I SAM-dependent methyltransferase [Ramlibacter]MBE7938988.1 class I SAM-dependent methyltransferase [Ramlibacter aquaticus]